MIAGGNVPGLAPPPSMRPAETGERLRRGVSLADVVASGGEVFMAVDAAGGPADLDLVGELRPAQAEVEAGVSGGEVAPPSGPMGDPGAAAGPEGDARSDGVAVRLRPFEADGERMASLGLV